VEGATVHSSFELWLVGFVALAAGVATGYLLPRYLKLAALPKNALEEELDALKTKHETYRHDVANHFGKTAELLEQLIGNYREVHNHLAYGAEELCQNEAVKLLKPLPESRTLEQQIPKLMEAPRDYAPKTILGGKSVLDEDFGIEKIHRATTPEPPRY